MARIKRGVGTRRKHKKVLKMARGFKGQRSVSFRVANQAVMKSLMNSYAHRKTKKRDFRKLWITRINAAARQNGVSYNRFINGLKQAGIEINRKMLAELAVNDKAAFTQLIEVAKNN